MPLCNPSCQHLTVNRSVDLRRLTAAVDECGRARPTREIGSGAERVTERTGMRTTMSGVFLAAILAVSAFVQPVQSEEISEEQSRNFRDRVFPLLESRCFECHGDQENVEAGLRMTSRSALLRGGDSGPAVVPTDPDQSLLIQAVRYEAFQMPPRNRMPDDEIRILSEWIRDGAPWPKDLESMRFDPGDHPVFPLKERVASHWAWRLIQPQTVPEVKDTEWPTSDIDRFLLAKMEAAGIEPALDTDRRSLLRRICFDLTGLPPSTELQERFYSDPSETPIAFESVVDELLASPRFGERWARHWLDLVRYAETLGHEFDYPLHDAWRYRDYVIRAFNEDVPYRMFITEHIAGDLTETPRHHPALGFNESIIGTTFWFLGEDKHAPVDVRAEEALRIDNQIDVFGKTFLGLTIACARCHDHKFDPITAEDYYALSGFLQSSRRRIAWLDRDNGTETLLTRISETRNQLRDEVSDSLQAIDHDLVTAVLEQAVDRSVSTAADQSGNAEQGLLTHIGSVLDRDNTRDISDPLSLLAGLRRKPAEISAYEAARAWLRKCDEAVTSRTRLLTPVVDSQESNADGIRLLADFRNGLPEGWFVHGAAFGLHPETGRPAVDGRPGSSDRVNDPSFMAYPSLELSNDPSVRFHMTALSSGALSPRLKGQLLSPEFELTHPEVHILVAGRGTRVRLTIDGYVMNEFSELLFSGCRHAIDTDGQFRWIRLVGDVGRYVGHRCHLEFLDEGDGWFAVREVRLAPGGAPGPVPEEISEVNRRLISQLDLNSAESIVQQWYRVAASTPQWPDIAEALNLRDSDSRLRSAGKIALWSELSKEPQPGDSVFVMSEGTGEDEYIFIRGNHSNRGAVASRRLLTALDGGQPLRDAATSGRRELAERVLADDNPFPARVIVNRVWQQLFGRGIVPTSDNFGVLGEHPTHPELLDFLADEFRRDGWSVKRLIRRMVLSRSYQLSSRRSAVADDRDPTNRLFHRFAVRRIEGEAIRDSILVISGRLDETMYGPPVPVYLSPFMQGRGRPGESGPLDGAGRRSIYQAVRRNFLNPFMLAFDTPQPATTVGNRSRSNVPAQALMLLNNEFVHEQSARWARRLLAEPVADGGIQDSEGYHRILNHAYRQALARSPSDNELTTMTEFAISVGAEKRIPASDVFSSPEILAEICHVLINQKEFLFLD